MGAMRKYTDRWMNPPGADDARRSGLPSRVGGELWSRLASKYDAQGNKRVAAAPPPPPPAPLPEPKTPDAPFYRMASMADLPKSMTPLGTGLFKNAHGVWELRPAEDGPGYNLVRKEEERAPDFRNVASNGKMAKRATLELPPDWPAWARVGARVMVAQMGGMQPAIVEGLEPEEGAVDVKMEGGPMDGMLDESVPLELVFIVDSDALKDAIDAGEAHGGAPMGKEDEPVEELVDDVLGDVGGELEELQAECPCCGKALEDHDDDDEGGDEKKEHEESSPSKSEGEHNFSDSSDDDSDDDSDDEGGGGGGFEPNVEPSSKNARHSLTVHAGGRPVGPVNRWATTRRAALKVADFRPSELVFVAQGAAIADGLPASAGRVTPSVKQAAERFAEELGRALMPVKLTREGRQAIERAAGLDLALKAYWDVSGAHAGLVDALDELTPRELQAVRRALHQNQGLRQAALALDNAAKAAVRVA